MRNLPRVDGLTVPEFRPGRGLLLAWKRRMGYNQREAAEHIGVHPVQLCQYLTGSRAPSIDVGVLIESKTGIPIESWCRRRGAEVVNITMKRDSRSKTPRNQVQCEQVVS